MKMASDNSSAIKQLLDIYNKSKLNGEWASLSLETKGGKEHILFSLGCPTRNQNGLKSPIQKLNWKTPSQQRRDQRRKIDFLAKKKTTLDIVQKEEIKTEPSESDATKATLVIPLDEINLEPVAFNPSEPNIFKIKGDFKDPNRKPWLNKINPDEDEHKAFWNTIEDHKDKIGLVNFSDSSTYIEHFLEFWGDLLAKPEIDLEHLKDKKNWPAGITNLQVKRI